MKKKLAVIGYGGQGAWHCMKALQSDVVELSGIYDIRESRREAAKKAGIFVYGSNEELLSDPAVEIVTVAIPNDQHLEWVVKSLEAGKNVICEKPVALSVADFDRMTAAAEKAGKRFSVHQNRRWDVDYLAMKHLAESGEIGKLINVESRIHGSRGIPSDWRCKKQYGGGMILDWGVHLIDQMLKIYDGVPIRDIYCETTHITNKEVDDGFKLVIHFTTGARAYVEVGTYNFLPLPRFYMQCENGSALLEDWQQKTKVAKLKMWVEKDVTPVQNAAGITKTMAPRDDITLDLYELDRPQSDVHDFYRNFCAAIDGKEEQLIKLSESRRVLKVMEACFASAEKGQAIPFDETT